eukprot:COSAG05_NODE_2137_length_3497_cov_1.466451_6_plen_69_part_00
MDADDQVSYPSGFDPSRRRGGVAEVSFPSGFDPSLRRGSMAMRQGLARQSSIDDGLAGGGGMAMFGGG